MSFVALAAIAVSAGWPQSSASAQSSSDPRARGVDGNVTTCAGVGFASDVQVGSSSNGNASDAHVAGTVKSNAGTIDPGEGQELDVAVSGSAVVIDAIVVKGGPAYNLYTNPSVLPPAVAPDQHYVAPFNRGGNLPTISHWFVCYRAAPPPPPPPTTTSTTTTVPATTTTTPPVTTTVAPTTLAPTTTTPTTEAIVAGHVAKLAPPKASTTTVPVTTTTKPPRHVTTTTEVMIAARTRPETGASTAAFVVGCATAVMALAVLVMRSRW